ncbi:GDP-mannose 4,6-dehydratase [Anaeroselena agilis]|uniref:GDP-mannose 4,6-dehydratase n=1 Tax=Anaeroselena agilis TaxID=3063788 RepID=A0ABU3P483_9FIRM|nr:GDP-mannose 4,6-dehydratase [Selenomonadales bacterium 4137-cl]
MKRAVIVGSGGQDGTILHEQLKNRGYAIIGIAREVVTTTEIEYPRTVIDIADFGQVRALLRDFQPHEVYYLAAFHQSSQDSQLDEIELFQKSYRVNVEYLVHFLEAIRKHATKTRLFYAASSHVFGDGTGECQDEETPLNPVCVYGMTKAAGLLACRYYRDKYAVFATTGILYNHESRYRSPNFVSKKIIKSAVDIKNGQTEKLVLGNLKAEIDWGFAPDYAEAMHSLLEIDVAGEYIIATGQKHTVLDFVVTAFSLLGLNWEKYVIEDVELIQKPSFLRIGNPQKLTAATGWKPKTSFEQMIQILLRDEGALV